MRGVCLVPRYEFEMQLHQKYKPLAAAVRPTVPTTFDIGSTSEGELQLKAILAMLRMCIGLLSAASSFSNSSTLAF